MEAYIYVFLLSFIYIIVSRLLLNKFVNKSYMKKYREKMNEINKRFVKASKENNVKELERLHEIQKKEIIPMTGKIVKEQFKMMFIVIVLFTIAMYFLPFVDTTTYDDVKFNYKDNKVITLDKEGVWNINIMKNGKNVGVLKIGVNKEENDLINETKVNGALFYVDKKVYSLGDKIELKAKGDVSEDYVIDYDRGTRLSIYLGIPFIEKVEGSYGVFILFVIILGIIASLIENQIEKMKNVKKG